MNEGKETTFIDLFSGIGGFRLGLRRANCNMDSKLTTGKGRRKNKEGTRADFGGKNGNRGRKHIDDSRGFKHVWSCDNNKYANQVYTRHFGEADHNSGDVRGVDTGEIPSFDLLCAGFPCQSFSVAGKREGFEDTRGTLFFEICRIAEAKRPPLLLLENVRGLLSHDEGLTFQIILESLEELGYWVEWQVLNSKHFGVPQNRRRVFIIGHLRGTGGREIFPITEADELAEGEGDGGPPVSTEVGSAIHSRYGAGWRAHGQEQLVSTAIDGSYHKGVDRHGQRTVVGVTLANTSRYRQGVKRSPMKQDDSSFALGAGGDQGVAISFTKPRSPDEERKVNLGDVSRAVKPPYGNQQPLVIGNIYPSGGEAGQIHDSRGIFSTVKQGKRGGKAGVPPILDDFRIRRLTPVECERLQGFPDGWTEGISDTRRYQCLGNAVTVNVIEYLGRRIMEAWP